MESSGHFGFTAVITYILVWVARSAGIVIGWWDGAALILGAAFLASLPDIDLRLRRVGVRHRGFTHTVWFAALLSAGTYLGLDYLCREGVKPPISPMTASVTVALAVMTHILADAMNYQRVRPLAPLSSAGVALKLFRSSSGLANAGFFLVGAGSVTAYFYGLPDEGDTAAAAAAGLVLVTALAALADRLARRRG